MKKFFIIFLIFMMVTGVTNAATFSDTVGMNCEFAVDRISYLGIVKGTSDNTYSPQKAVTRAEFAKMITNIMGGKSGTNVKNFSDIENHWGKVYIQKAASLGYINGYADGTFKPDKEVSYAEAITIIMRCLGYNDLDNKSSGAWYDNYLTEMKKINLDSELEEFSPNSPANRGDVAVILWNMINTDFRVKDTNNGQYKYNSKSIREEYFSGYYFVNNAEVKSITSDNKKICYVTSEGNFYIDKVIDFSNLGGTISGFYDTKTNSFIGFKVDEGLSLKKISGSIKDISDMGYALYTINKLCGYGDKDYAEYAEIFVDEKTNEIVRAVYYDTRESHFAEKIKVGTKGITIESRDVYDHSIVILKDGTKITYDILRTESVKDINVDALLISDGKIVDWTSVPNDSVIREIEKNKIYTYTHKYISGKLESDKLNLTTLKMNGKKYIVHEDCICQNSLTKQTMKLTEGLTASDIKKIGENDSKVKIYLNEFDEVVKVEFAFDIWELHEQEEKKEKREDIEEILRNMGLVSKVDTRIYMKNDQDIEETELSVYSYKDEKLKKYSDVGEETFTVGDLVYIPSGEENLKVIKNKLELDNVQVVLNYLYPITEKTIGNFYFDEDSKIFEVVLERSQENRNEYSNCTLRNKTISELSEYTRYKNIYVIADGDNTIIKMYALKEVGSNVNLGIVGNITTIMSGDAISSITTYLTGENGKSVKYNIGIPVMGYGTGDLITYSVIANTYKPTEKEKKKKIEILDTLVVDEVYRHEHIGNKYDLIVKDVKKGKCVFENSDMVLDLNLESFVYNGKTHFFDDYMFVNVEVIKNIDTKEWHFNKFKIKEQSTFLLDEGYRIAINEITGTIIAYKGYVED